MTSHHTSAGARHKGDELDCEQCRTALYEALRQPPGAPEHVCTPGESCTAQSPCPACLSSGRYVPGPRRHLELPPEHTRTVDLTGHRVESFVEPYPDRPGGLWSAVCACGWSRGGPYARDGAGEIVADRLAEAWADRHRKNPLEGTEEE